jgi:glutathione S-transferase
VKSTPELEADIARVATIWRSYRGRSAARGPFLFGDFSIADAMFAPVACRFRTYGVACDGAGGEYLATLLDHPAMRRWAAASETESEVVAESEVGC